VHKQRFDKMIEAKGKHCKCRPKDK